MLTLQDGRFWPARLNSTPLPDIFGVVVEGQRGNRPNIMARDDILNQAVRYMNFFVKFFSLDITLQQVPPNFVHNSNLYPV